MTVKTTLSFTDRHHRFLMEKVAQGVFASQSAAVAAALEEMMREEEERALTREAMRDLLAQRREGPFVTLDQGTDSTKSMIARKRSERGL